MTEITFDPAKSRRNIAERGLSFELAAELDWETALIRIDNRRDYGEARYLAMAKGEGELYAVAYTMRATHDAHPITIRGVMRIEVRDGEVSRRVDYWDALTFLKQTGQA